MLLLFMKFAIGLHRAALLFRQSGRKRIGPTGPAAGEHRDELFGFAGVEPKPVTNKKKYATTFYLLDSSPSTGSISFTMFVLFCFH